MRTLPDWPWRNRATHFSVFHGASARTAIAGVSMLTRATASNAL